MNPVCQVGVMYCRAGQQTEEEMYNNEEGGPAFNEFLDVIGQRVRLKGFAKYKAGLCNKSKSTLFSLFFPSITLSFLLFQHHPRFLKLQKKQQFQTIWSPLLLLVLSRHRTRARAPAGVESPFLLPP